LGIWGFEDLGIWGFYFCFELFLSERDVLLNIETS
jgi:hypothetical protein